MRLSVSLRMLQGICTQVQSIFHASAGQYSSYQQNRRKTHEGTSFGKERCDKCKVIHRHGKVYVLREPAYKRSVKENTKLARINGIDLPRDKRGESDSPIFTALVELVQPRFATRLVSIINTRVKDTHRGRSH